MESIQEFKAELKKQLGRAELAEVISRLKQTFPVHAPVYTNTILIGVRMEKMEQNRRMGVISIESAEQTYSAILADLIQLVDSLTEKDLNPEPSDQEGSLAATLEKVAATPGLFQRLGEQVSLASKLRRRRLEDKVSRLEGQFEQLLEHIKILNDQIKIEVDPIRKHQFQTQITAKEDTLIKIEQEVDEIESELQ